MHFIIESRRPCGHIQREMIEAKTVDKANEIDKKHQSDICDMCCNRHLFRWFLSHKEEAQA
jgi:hypothetical protein